MNPFTLIGACGPRVVVSILLLSCMLEPALADMESLIEKLHEKGVLSNEEYEELSADVRDERREAAAAAAEANDPDKMSGSFKGGLKFTSQDGQHSFQIHGRVQADYNSSDVRDNDEFDIRRAFLGVKGMLYGNWTYEVTSDVNLGRMEYAYLNYKRSHALEARAGFFKFPFGFSQLTSSLYTDFMERSFVNNYEPGKDQGVMVHGEPKKNVFSYALGYANGSGRTASPTVDKKDLIARSALDFAPMFELDDAVLHVGLDYRKGAFEVSDVEYDRTATGVEGVAAYGPLKLQGEYQQIDLGTDTAANPDVNVYYVSAMWLITGESYADGYSPNGMKSIKPNKPLHAGGKGAWEVGVQFASVDAEQSTVGTLNADSTTFGIKWIPNENVRFLLNWVENKFDVPVTIGTATVEKETQINARAQIHF